MPSRTHATTGLTRTGKIGRSRVAALLTRRLERSQDQTGIDSSSFVPAQVSTAHTERVVDCHRGDLGQSSSKRVQFVVGYDVSKPHVSSVVKFQVLLNSDEITSVLPPTIAPPASGLFV
jgi:hypothetical protein